MKRALATAALVVGLGCGGEPAVVSPEPTGSAAAPAAAPAVAPVVAPDSEPATWADELADVDRQIVHVLRAADRDETDWLNLDRAASLLLTRARLSGSYDDYARAEELLGRAFERAPGGSGPVATQVSLDFSLHRLDRVGPNLDALDVMPPMMRPKPEVQLRRRGALALQLGRYDDARGLLQRSVDAGATLPNLSVLALYFWQTGELAEAERLYGEALAQYHGRAREPVAWVHLQLGLIDLDRGSPDEALQHYREAGAQLGGWYLVDEHIAEALTLLGRTDEAVVLYRRVIARTGHPEFMDAMAGIEAARGDETASHAWVERARLLYEARLLRFPEAAVGHALDHFLEFGPASRAVVLATRNHALRPSGEAKVKLARAWLSVGRTDDARRLTGDVLASPYRSPALAALAAGLDLAAAPR